MRKTLASAGRTLTEVLGEHVRILGADGRILEGREAVGHAVAGQRGCLNEAPDTGSARRFEHGDRSA
jgi:hypothetical protein